MRIFSGIFDEAFFRPEMKNDSLAAYSLDVIIDQEISYSIFVWAKWEFRGISFLIGFVFQCAC